MPTGGIKYNVVFAIWGRSLNKISSHYPVPEARSLWHPQRDALCDWTTNLDLNSQRAYRTRTMLKTLTLSAPLTAFEPSAVCDAPDTHFTIRTQQSAFTADRNCTPEMTGCTVCISIYRNTISDQTVMGWSHTRISAKQPVLTKAHNGVFCECSNTGFYYHVCGFCEANVRFPEK